jgi:hypothetical protein
VEVESLREKQIGVRLTCIIYYDSTRHKMLRCISIYLVRIFSVGAHEHFQYNLNEQHNLVSPACIHNPLFTFHPSLWGTFLIASSPCDASLGIFYGLSESKSCCSDIRVAEGRSSVTNSSYRYIWDSAVETLHSRSMLWWFAWLVLKIWYHCV